MKKDLSNYELEYRSDLWFVVAKLVCVVVALAFVFSVLGCTSSATGSAADIKSHKAFSGGKHEASGVAHVPGTDTMLFVDDGRPGEVFLMKLDADGNQSGDIKAVSLGVNIEDTEGITTDGTHFYVVSSQAKKKGSQAGLVRFKFNVSNQTAEAVESVNDLKALLVGTVAELRDMADVKAKDDGINIEGLAWDFANNRLLLGLRSPVASGKALIVALKLRDPKGQFTNDNVTVEAKAIRVALGGLGVRSIEFDDRAKVFRILAGATETADKTDFKLYEWGGTEATQPREVATINGDLKPEGVARATVNGREFTFLVFDSSGYARID